MKQILLVVAVLIIVVVGAQSAEPEFGFGELDLVERGPWISERQLNEIKQEIRANRERMILDGTIPRSPVKSVIKFGWPVKAADHLTDPGFYGVSGFPDNNPLYPNQILDFNCGSRSYDLDIGYNHAGTDIFNWPFLWNKMDNDDVEVIAAYDGLITYKLDGNDDRSCGLGGGNANVIVLYHDNGSYTVYGHMKKWSLPPKTRGNTVVKGEYLGVVGSSGQSTGPHLHFEVWENDSTLLDPWVGPCNPTTAESWWEEQKPYYDPALNKISTHSAPVEWGACPDPDVTNIADAFEPGDMVFYYVFGRDLLRYDEISLTIYRPDESVFGVYDYVHNASNHSPAFFIYWGSPIPTDEETGTWRFEALYKDVTYGHQFTVGGVPVFFNVVTGNVVDEGVELRWDVRVDERLGGFDVYRIADGETVEESIVDGILLNPATRRFVDTGVQPGDTYRYIIAAVEEDGTRVWSLPVEVVVASVRLSVSQNYPNPFNPETTIEFVIPETSPVELSVYDTQGRLVVTLVHGIRSGGVQRVIWDGRDKNGDGVSAGVYFYRLESSDRVVTKKMVLLK